MAESLVDSQWGELVQDEQGALSLRFPENSKLKPLVVDFVGGEWGFKLDRKSIGKSHPLAKAIGLKNQPNFVLDATAGFCGDSLVLRLLGVPVIALERNKVVFQLVKDAISRALASEKVATLFSQDFEYRQADAFQVIKDWTGEKPDVVFLDPMFPSKSKSSLVNKKMQVLQQILGEDQGDARALLQKALRLAGDRVVVKRPRLAPVLVENPTFQFMGKSIRYDMYLSKSVEP